jgi:hypothetical protein
MSLGGNLFPEQPVEEQKDTFIAAAILALLLKTLLQKNCEEIRFQRHHYNTTYDIYSYY